MNATHRRATELLEQYALAEIDFTGAGRSGRAHWRCHGCRSFDPYSKIGLLSGDDLPHHLRKPFRNYPSSYGTAARLAFRLIKHSPDCRVTEALRIVAEIVGRNGKGA
jgi:hypothetical protein